MQRIRRTSYRRRYKRGYIYKDISMVFREKWKLITLISLFIAGLIIGASTVKNTDSQILSKLITIFSDYSMLRRTQSILDTFCNSLLVSIIYFLIAFVAGLCAVGIPFITMVPLARGIGLGMIAGYLYNTYALSGFGYCALLIYPGAILSTAALLFGCNESILMSYDVYLVMSDKQTNMQGNSVKKYCFRYLVLMIIVFAAAILDVIMTVAFSNMFTLQ